MKLKLGGWSFAKTDTSGKMWVRRLYRYYDYFFTNTEVLYFRVKGFAAYGVTYLNILSV